MPFDVRPQLLMHGFIHCARGLDINVVCGLSFCAPRRARVCMPSSGRARLGAKSLFDCDGDVPSYDQRRSVFICSVGN